MILFRVPSNIPSEVFLKGEILKDHRTQDPPEDIIEVEVSALGSVFIINSSQIIKEVYEDPQVLMEKKVCR